MFQTSFIREVEKHKDKALSLVSKDFENNLFMTSTIIKGKIIYIVASFSEYPIGHILNPYP